MAQERKVYEIQQKIWCMMGFTIEMFILFPKLCGDWLILIAIHTKN